CVLRNQVSFSEGPALLPPNIMIPRMMPFSTVDMASPERGVGDVGTRMCTSRSQFSPSQSQVSSSGALSNGSAEPPNRTMFLRTGLYAIAWPWRGTGAEDPTACLIHVPLLHSQVSVGR